MTLKMRSNTIDALKMGIVAIQKIGDLVQTSELQGNKSILQRCKATQLRRVVMQFGLQICEAIQLRQVMVQSQL